MQGCGECFQTVTATILLRWGTLSYMYVYNRQSNAVILYTYCVRKDEGSIERINYETMTTYIFPWSAIRSMMSVDQHVVAFSKPLNVALVCTALCVRTLFDSAGNYYCYRNGLRWRKTRKNSTTDHEGSLSVRDSIEPAWYEKKVTGT